MHQCARTLTTLVVLFLAFYVYFRPVHEGDSHALVHDAANALGCFSGGHLKDQGGHCPQMGQFPLYQLVPSMALLALGLDHPHTVDFLVFCGFLSWAGILVLFYRHWRSRAPWIGLLASLIFMSGYPVGYINSSFGEMTAAFAVLALVYGLLNDWNPLVLFLTGAYAATTKEVALPFLVLLIASAALLRSLNPGRTGVPAVLAASGGFFGALLNGVANWFRFGTFRNTAYLDTPAYIVRGFEPRLHAFYKQWLAADGGLVVYWPLAVALLLYAGIRVAKSAGRMDRSKIALVFALLVPIGTTLGLTAWYCPRGEMAWGHRLVLPWLPAVLFLILHECTNDLPRVLRSLLQRNYLATPAILAASVTAWPHYRMLVYHTQLNHTYDSPLRILTAYDLTAVPLSTLFCAICASLWAYWALHLKQEIVDSR